MSSIFDLLKDKVEKEFTDNPPTIGVIGVSGVGKSSTLNAMFKTSLATSPTIRCTTEFNEHLVGAEITSGKRKGKKANLRVIDAPGLGEDVKQDPQYLDMYMENLPKCDVILWVLSARNRAIALDQYYLKKLSIFHDKMIFGINQVDLVEPLNWDYKNNMPSEEQQANILSITSDRQKRIEDVMGRRISITAYGAKQYYKLSSLFENMVNACENDRSWMFQLIKGFSAKDWLDKVEGLSQEEKNNIINGIN